MYKCKDWIELFFCLVALSKDDLMRRIINETVQLVKHVKLFRNFIRSINFKAQIKKKQNKMT